MFDPPEVIGPRLQRLRIALGYKTRVAFARAISVEKNTYSPWEKGTRALTFEAACKIRQRFKVPIDYLFWGDLEDQLPAAVHRRLTRAA